MMNEKTIIITGSNSGIGKAAAIQIAKEGHQVIMACRNQERGRKALEEISKASQSKKIKLIIVDMSLQSSIRQFVDEFTSKHDHLDVIIHNAAHFDIRQKKPLFTAENIESIWATNHIGPVLLTELVLEWLKKSKQGRIITVSSKGLIVFPNLKVSIEDPEFKNKKFSVQKSYYQSKLSQVMYTYWLSDKLKETDITVNCIRVTNVKIDISRYSGVSPFARSLYAMKSSFSISPDEMAKTYTYLALSDEITNVTGKYFDNPNKQVKSSKYTYQKENIEKLMNLTMSYIK